jgi:Fuc2NAc and GlcNAc transferase
MIAVLAVAGEQEGTVPLVAFGILGAVFVADATLTLLRRVARGARPAEAHRDHAYQRLTRAWGAHRPVTLAAGGATLVLAVLATAATLRPAWTMGALAIALAFLAALAVAAERRAPM